MALTSNAAVFVETFDGASYVNNQALNNSGLWAGNDEYLMAAAGEGVGGSDAIDHIPTSIGATFPLANFTGAYFEAPAVNDTFKVSVDFRIDPLASDPATSSTLLSASLTQSPNTGMGLRSFFQRLGPGATDYQLGIQYHRPTGTSGGFVTTPLTTAVIESNGKSALSNWLRLELTATKTATMYSWNFGGNIYSLGATGLSTPTLIASVSSSTTGNAADTVWTDSNGIYGGIDLQYVSASGALAGVDRLVMDNFTLEGDLIVLPEPSTTTLVLFGLALACHRLKRRTRRA